MFTQYLYKLYLHTLSLPLLGALIIIGWKKDTLSANARVCGLPQGLGFRIRFYQAAVLDLLRFLHGRYESPIFARPRDAGKIEHIKSGPSLFLSAHFHNWELMGAWMTRQGIPLMSAARPMAQGISQSLLIRLRDRLGMNVLFGAIPRRALRHVRGGGCFGLLWDQRVPASGSESGSAIGSESDAASACRAPLFGRTLSMDPLPHFLIRHAALNVYFGMLLPGGRFRVIQIAAPRTLTERHSFSLSGSSTSISSDSALGSQPLVFDSSLDPLAPDPFLATSGRVLGAERPGNQGSDLGVVQGRRPDETLRLARRYHRVLECLVRAYPTYWYGLAHRRFLS